MDQATPTGWLPDQCAANYYRAGMLKRAPDVVPSKVNVLRRATSELPFARSHVEPGEHECTSNLWGAISVKAVDGSQLGLRLDEFEPVTWRLNDKI